jgi:hypothetical protein
MRARQPTRAGPAVTKSTPWWEWPILLVTALLNVMGMIIAWIMEILGVVFLPGLCVD